MKRTSLRFLILAASLVFAFALFAGCAASDAPRGLLAQRGGQHCNADADCHVALPHPRACPHGGQSTPTACCRMNYCGVCWSDCPAGGARVAPSSTVAM